MKKPEAARDPCLHRPTRAGRKRRAHAGCECRATTTMPDGHERQRRPLAAWAGSCATLVGTDGTGTAGRPAAMTLVQALGALQLAPVAPAKTLLLRCRRCATTCSSLLSVAGASKLDPALPEINKRPLSFDAGSLAQGSAADGPSSSGQRVALSPATCCSCTGCSPVPNRR